MSPTDAPPGPMVPASFRVVHRTPETGDTWTLDLQPRHARALPDFAPGQFAMLYAFGVGEAPISVSGDLTCPGPLVHTIRDGRRRDLRAVQARAGAGRGRARPVRHGVAGGRGRGQGRDAGGRRDRPRPAAPRDLPPAREPRALRQDRDPLRRPLAGRAALSRRARALARALRRAGRGDRGQRARRTGAAGWAW